MSTESPNDSSGGIARKTNKEVNIPLVEPSVEEPAASSSHNQPPKQSGSSDLLPTQYKQNPNANIGSTQKSASQTPVSFERGQGTKPQLPQQTLSSPKTKPTDNVTQSEPPVVRLLDEEVLQKSRSLWREVEPKDMNDRVEHVATDHKIQDGMQIVAASRRGKSHAQDGKYREDAFSLAISGDWLVAAVADGAGSKPMARVGAQVASQAAIDHLCQTLSKPPKDDDTIKHLRGALTGALVHALACVSAEAAYRGSQVDVNDFASTLLLLAYRQTSGNPLVGIAQIGDGGIAAMLKSGQCALLGKADHGKFAGEALFLTSGETMLTWVNRVQILELTEPVHLVLVATDGVLDDFTPSFGTLANLFHEIEPIREATAPEEWLSSWLTYEKRSSFDDRTMAVLFPRSMS